VKKIIGAYKLKLPASIKIYNIFHALLLFKNPKNILLEQNYLISFPVIIKKDADIEWEVENIIDIKRVNKYFKIRV